MPKKLNMFSKNIQFENVESTNYEDKTVIFSSTQNFHGSSLDYS